MIKDNWDAPAVPLAPGLKLDPRQPKLEMEKVEFVEPSPDELQDIESLRAQNKRLKFDNDVLMRQIEESWAIIRARDDQIRYMQETPQPWNR